MSKYIICIFVSLAVSGCTNFLGFAPYDLKIVESGIYSKLDIIKQKQNSSAASGRNAVVKFNSSKLIESTDVIPLKKGVSFGLYYTVNSKKINRHTVTWTIYPPKNLVNPKSGASTESITSTSIRRSAVKYFVAYTLDHEYEMLPGQWKIEIKVGNQIKIMKFQLVDNITA